MKYAFNKNITFPFRITGWGRNISQTLKAIEIAPNMNV